MTKVIFEEITLTNARIKDYDFYYDLKSEPSNIYWSGHKNKPDYNSFKKWYIENAIEQRISFKFIEWKGEKIGAIYFKIDDKICTYLGLAISEKFQGKGIARLAVEKFIECVKYNYHNCEVIRFLIREDNNISIKIHEKLGCRKTGKFEYTFLVSDDKDIKMEEWELKLS